MKKIYFVSESFNKNSNQGIYRAMGYLKDFLEEELDVKEIIVPSSKSYFFYLYYHTIYLLIKTFFIKEKIIFSSPEVAFPVLIKRNSLCIIHDLIPLTGKERKRIFKEYFKILLNISIKSNNIICVSNFTRNKLIKMFPNIKNKTKTIYWGIDKTQFFKKKINKNKKIIGYLGGLGKRKKVNILIKIANYFPNYKFLIAGKGPELEKLIVLNKKNKNANINFIGFIPNKKINDFYNSLTLFVFPSEEEGFGFPPLEAYYSGTKVLCAKNSSLKEIGKNKFYFFKTNNELDLIKQIKVIVGKKNKKTDKQFEWKDTQQKYLEVLK